MSVKTAKYVSRKQRLLSLLLPVRPLALNLVGRGELLIAPTAKMKRGDLLMLRADSKSEPGTEVVHGLSEILENHSTPPKQNDPH
jgi:hypothetical protein